MRKLTLTILFCLLFSASLLAQATGPYLVCDPYPGTAGVSNFILFWDGATTGVTIPVFTDATGTYIHYDLSSLSNGAHTVKARAKNQWGESPDSTPFAFVKNVLTAPQNIKINPN